MEQVMLIKHESFFLYKCLRFEVKRNLFYICKIVIEEY